jgi:putative membrane protein
MNSPRIDWSQPQRQSWAAVFIILYKIIIRLLKIFWPVLIYYLFKNKQNQFDSFEMMIVGLSVFSLFGSIVEFIFFRFYIQDENLIIRSGFITKKMVSLPLNKIQAVHIEQTWLHSILNAARLSFDSAGSEKVEVKIQAINKKEAEDFKRFILHARPDVATDVETVLPPEETIIKLNSNDLLKLSLSANHLEAFVLMLAFFLSALEQIRDVFNVEYNSFLDWVSSFNTSFIAALLAGVIVALTISIIISSVRVVLRYYDFTINRSARGYFIHSGLVNIQEKLVPFSKIQYISWSANWVRQKLGLYLLHFHAIGSEDIQEKLRVKVPITNVGMIPLLLQQYHPLLPVDTLTPLRIHRAYIFRRILISGLIPMLVLSIPGYFYFGQKVLLLAIWVLIITVTSILFQRKFRLWTDAEALQIRKGYLGRGELVLRWDMIQSVTLQQSIYQEGHELATINLYTAGGTVAIPYIPVQRAREIMNYALYMIECDRKITNIK